MSGITFFRGIPKGESLFAGSFASLEADLGKGIVEKLKMLPALKRFAKFICEQEKLKGVQFVSIRFMTVTDTRDEFVKI